MQIQINADHRLDSSESRDQWARSVIESALSHIAEQVTRVEVHFGAENAGPGALPDIRCLLEARLKERPPVAVTNHAESVDRAFDGAVHKLVNALEHELGRAARHARDARATPVDDLAT